MVLGCVALVKIVRLGGMGFMTRAVLVLGRLERESLGRQTGHYGLGIGVMAWVALPILQDKCTTNYGGYEHEMR